MVLSVQNLFYCSTSRCFILAVVFWICSSTTVAKLSLDYEFTWEPTEGYIIRWSIADNSTLNLALEVQTLGWIGFGIGEPGSGRMAGADMVTGFVNSSGGFIVDRWANLQGMTPEPDHCQDWTLVAFAEDSKRGHTTLELRRALVTQDTTQDRTIDDNNFPTRIIGAWGATDKFQMHDFKFVRTLNFFLGPSTDPIDVIKSKEDLQEITFANTNYHVPSDKMTIYSSACFDLAYLREPLHIVALSAKNSVQTKDVLHHALLFGHRGANCTGEAEYLSSHHQDDITHQVFPSDAGIRIGGPGGLIQSIKLQSHFHNPNFLSGFVDNSGVVALTTTKLRQHDVGVMELGDPWIKLNGQKILSGISRYSFVCASSCTKHMAGPVTVFKTVSHMHRTGKRMDIEVIRGGKNLGSIDTTDYYNHMVQSKQSIKPFRIKPKDWLRLACIYETDGNTTFGRGSNAEMCIQRLYFYPKKNSFRPDGKCGLGFCRANLRRPISVRSLSSVRKWGKTKQQTFCQSDDATVPKSTTSTHIAPEYSPS